MSIEINEKRSAIWMHFSLLNDNKAKCSYCQKVISYTGGATGNLGRHLKTQHVGVIVDRGRYLPEPSSSFRNRPDTSTSHQNATANTAQTLSRPNNTSFDPNAVETRTSSTTTSTDLTFQNFTPPQRQQTISHFVRRPISVSFNKQLDEQLTKTIVKQYYPFSMVEDTEFKEFVRMLCPSYQMPSRKTISNSLIPRLFNESKVKVQEKLSSVEAVCVTTDGWTSITQQSYIGMTVHYIQEENDGLVLKSSLLGCIPYDESHTISNLGNLLKSELQNWGLAEKVVCVVTDNASNIVGAVRYNNWSHFPYFAHTLNLVLGEGISLIDVQLGKIKNIVSFFKKSSRATVKLGSMQKELNLPELKLKQSCITRWNSTYEMLSRIIKVKFAVLAVLAIENTELSCLTSNEWKTLEKAVEIFQIFQAITEEISADKNVTISKTMLMVKSIKNHIHKISVANHSLDYDPLVEQILSTLSNALHNRFKNLDNNVDERVAQATFLDPRFKKFGFPNTSSYERCLNDLKSKTLPPASNLNATVEAEPNTFLQPSTSSSTRQSSSLIWEDFDLCVDHIIANPNQRAATIVQIDKYVSEQLLRRELDPLKWWSDRKHIYPGLYRLALRRLCIVATSVPCERVFSKAGLTIENRRSSLKPEKAAQCLFLNYNL